MLSKKFFLVCCIILGGCNHIGCQYHMDNDRQEGFCNLSRNREPDSLPINKYKGPTTFKGAPLHIVPTKEWADWHSKHLKSRRYLIKYASTIMPNPIRKYKHKQSKSRYPRRIMNHSNYKQWKSAINIFLKGINNLFPDVKLNIDIKIIIPFLKAVYTKNIKDMHTYAKPIVHILTTASANVSIHQCGRSTQK